MRVSRRKFLLTGGLALAGVASASAYPVWVEPRMFEVRHTQIPVPWLPEGKRVRILQFSDIHAGPSLSFETLAGVLQLGIAEKPDLICLTGDFVTRELTTSIDGYSEVLSALPTIAPTFASLGNHDGGAWAVSVGGYSHSATIIDMLTSAGIEVLHNRNVELDVRGERLVVIGLGDLWSREFDFRSAFRGLPKVADCARVVLSHNPDTKDILIYGTWDLLLSGHTHGGQVRLPGFAPPILPVTDRRFYDGYYYWKKRHIYVSRGVGGVAGGIRFNCRPEVGVLDLVAAGKPDLSAS